MEYKSILDYGAVSDALLDEDNQYRRPNPQATDCTTFIQNAIDDNYGKKLIFPRGSYYVAASSGSSVILWLKNAIHLYFEPGAKLFCSGSEQQDILLVENSGSVWERFIGGSILENVQLRPFAGYAKMRHGIVNHAGFTRIIKPIISDLRGWCIISESGLQSSNNFFGASFTDQYVNSNFVVIDGGWLAWGGALADGSPNYSGSLYAGGGIMFHGSDTNGSTIKNVFADHCNVGFHDQSIGGVEHIQCYSEAGGRGFVNYSAAGGSYTDCQTEDVQGVSNVGLAPVVSGRTNIKGGKNPVTTNNGSVSEWAIDYNAGLPKARIMKRIDLVDIQPDANSPKGHVDFAGAAFGWTEGDHPRGPDLAFFARPILNTIKRWTWKQNITLQPGYQPVKTAPNWWYSHATMKSDLTLPDHEVRLVGTIELPSTDDLYLSQSQADAQINARITQLNNSQVIAGATICLYRDNEGGSWAVQVWNMSSSSVNVNIVWHCEHFQRSTQYSDRP